MGQVWDGHRSGMWQPSWAAMSWGAAAGCNGQLCISAPSKDPDLMMSSSSSLALIFRGYCSSCPIICHRSVCNHEWWLAHTLSLSRDRGEARSWTSLLHRWMQNTSQTPRVRSLDGAITGVPPQQTVPACWSRCPVAVSLVCSARAAPLRPLTCCKAQGKCCSSPAHWAHGSGQAGTGRCRCG